MRIAAFIDHRDIPVNMGSPRCLSDAVPVENPNFLCAEFRYVAVIEIADILGVRQECRNVRRAERLALPASQDKGGSPANALDFVGDVVHDDSQSEGPVEAPVQPDKRFYRVSFEHA